LALILFVGSIATGGLAGALGGIVASTWNKRILNRHSVSIDFIPSDAAKPVYQKVEPRDLVDDVFPPEPVLVPPKEGDPFTYQVLVRNNGSGPERDVQILVRVQDAVAAGNFIDKWDIACSSALVLNSMSSSWDRDEPRELMLSLPRLNVGEWISATNSWRTRAELVVTWRSDNFSKQSTS
jgi:hypothetical protein